MTGLLWLPIVGLGLTALAVGAELAARWWLRHRRQYYVFPPGLRLRLRPDPECFPELERQVRFDVNREGERGDEVPRLDPGERLYRILVAGGSQPEGYLLDQATSWPGALQRLLQAPERLRRLGASRVHVGNIARSGVAADALERILECVLPRYTRLQAIVVLVGASDVLRWLEQGAPPRPPIPAGTADIFRSHPEGPFGWKPGTLALLELALRLRRQWLRPEQAHERVGRWIGRARAMRARAREVRTAMPDPTPMLDHFELHFRRLLERAKTQADRVLVVRQPWFDKECDAKETAHMWHGGVGQAWQEEITTYYAFDVVARLMALLDARAAGVAKEVGVEQLDLMPILEPTLRNYYDFFHVTPAGALVVAHAVAGALLPRTVVAPPGGHPRREGPRPSADWPVVAGLGSGGGPDRARTLETTT